MDKISNSKYRHLLGIGPPSAPSRIASYSIHAVIVHHNLCRNIYSAVV
jgi:hypothetical protein